MDERVSRDSPGNRPMLSSGDPLSPFQFTVAPRKGKRRTIEVAPTRAAEYEGEDPRRTTDEGWRLPWRRDP